MGNLPVLSRSSVVIVISLPIVLLGSALPLGTLSGYITIMRITYKNNLFLFYGSCQFSLCFRCFLLRLGFIGEEYKTERKILLKSLSGSSAFKSGAKKDYAPGLDPVPTPENTVPFDVEEAKRRLQDPAVQAEVRAIINGEDGDAE